MRDQQVVAARTDEGEGLDVAGSTVDLSDPLAAAAWVEACASRLGGIDVVYNNAAGYGFAPFAEMTVDLWRHVIRVELDLVFHVTQPAWRHLVASGAGSVINTSSYTAVRGFAPLGAAAHAAAKAGVHGFTKALALEVARKGVTVNTISPGYIGTKMVTAIPEDILNSKILPQIPVGRLGKPEEIAGLIIYLASEEAAFVTGANIAINGGQHMQ